MEGTSDATAAFVAAWEAVVPDGSLQQVEACIDDKTPLLDGTEFTSVAAAPGTPQAAFVSAVFDSCLTDDQATAYYASDMLRQDAGFTAESAACLADGIQAEVRQAGFASVFLDPTPEAADAVELARLRCGVIGPSRKGEARFFAGLRSADADRMAAGGCPGAFATTDLDAVAARLSELPEAELPTRFLLVSEPGDAPERWSTSVAGVEAVLTVTTGTFDDGSLCVAAVSATPSSAIAYLVPG